MQTSDSYSANLLLEYSSGRRWTVTDGSDRFTKHAALFSEPNRPPLLSFDFETQPPSAGTLSAGQLFFLPTATANAYLLGWYVCPKANTPTEHLFGLVSAQELFIGVNRNTVHKAPERLVARRLADTLPLTANAPYDAPDLYQAVQKVIHADLQSLSDASMVEYDSHRERQIAMRAARTVEDHSDKQRKRATMVDADELADAMSGMGVDKTADPMTGLFAALPLPRRVVRARRQFGNLPKVDEGP